MDQKVTGWIDQLMNKLIEWIDNIFKFFGMYSTQYSKWILGLLGLYIVTKMLNIRLNLGGGRRGG